LREGLTYTVISEVPYRNRTLLQKALIEAVPDGNLYLQIPEKTSEKIRKRTEELLATSPQPITAPYEKALFLAQALKQQYAIQPDIPALTKDQDLVEAFLFRFKGGYPDHFSSALTVMLRSIGIPSRLVAGFAPGQFNPFTGLYEVKNTDAYAMTEVYFPNYGWFAFDPIPGHELVPPSIEEDQTFTVLQRFWKWVAGWLPSPVTSVLNRVFGAIVQWLGSILSWIVGLFFKGWIGLFSGLILLTGLSFLGWLSWQGWQKWRYRRWLKKLPPMESLYQQMLSWLEKQGFRKHPSQTPLEYARQSQGVQMSRAQTIQEISQAYVSWRYGGQTPDLRSLQHRFREMRKTKVKGGR
jgi:transglutaminase-like putative cysteine protease